MLNGIDISKWQKQPNFDRVKNLVQFVILRSSYGDGFTDPQFKRNKSECRRLDIPLGYYHYAYPQYNSPQAEAAWFLKAVGDIKNGELLVLDIEEHYSGDIVAWSKNFLMYIQDKLKGYKPLIYLNLSQTKSYNWKPIVENGNGLWLARYDYNPEAEVPNTPWSVVAMRQWTSSGRVDGIEGNVDLNVFYGDLTAFRKYGYKEAVPPTPPNYTLICQQVKQEVNSGDSNDTKVAKIRDLVSNV